jgi:hypothetical protein
MMNFAQSTGKSRAVKRAPKEMITKRALDEKVFL